MDDLQTRMTIALVAHYYQLIENFQTSDDWEERGRAENELEAFIADYPDIVHYDDEGNYVGSRLGIAV